MSLLPPVRVGQRVVCDGDRKDGMVILQGSRA